MKKRVIAFVASIVILSVIVMGCSNSTKQDTTTKTTTTTTTGTTSVTATTGGESTKSTTVAEEFPKPNIMPITQEDITLKVLTAFPTQHAQYHVSINDVPSMKELEKITNIKVDWMGIPSANYAERKTLIFASGDLPDIVFLNPADKDILMYGVMDDLLIELDDLVEKYAYHFNKWTESEPAVYYNSLAPDGKLYQIPSIDISLAYAAQYGYLVRESWLKELNVNPPETLDELYNVLKLMKDADLAGKGETIPLAGQDITFLAEPIFSSYGTKTGLYQVDGEVKFGPLENDYVQGLKYLNKLYSEGLIHPDYIAHDQNTYNTNIVKNIGITYTFTASGLTTPFEAAGITTEQAFNEFRPIANMKGPSGVAYDLMKAWGRVTNNIGDAITVSNKYPVESIKWIDYKYSQEGSWTVFWGEKGKTWDIDDSGTPYITDYVLKNPDGVSSNDIMMQNGMNWHWTGIAQVFNRYIRTSEWPLTYDHINLNYNRYGELPKTLYSENVDNWFKVDMSRVLPVALRLTDVEQERADLIMRDITTFIDENLHKYIMGLQNINDWEKVIDQLKNMNVDELISIYQDALDRVPR